MTDITKIINEIKTMEKEQEKARMEFSRLSGQRESEIKRLKTEFEVKDVEEAEKALDKLQKRLTTIDEKIIGKYNDLKQKYDTTPA